LPDRPCLAGYGNTLKFGIVTPQDGGGGGEEVDRNKHAETQPFHFTVTIQDIVLFL
jgi:hypothetical protein